MTNKITSTYDKNMSLIKCLIVIIAIILIEYSDSKSINEEWNKWRLKYKKSYRNEREEANRYHLWKLNYEYIQNVKELNLTYNVAASFIADLNNDEWSELRAQVSQMPKRLDNETKKQIINSDYNETFIPGSIDWRIKGIVSPVKNQGTMGSSALLNIVDSISSTLALYSGALNMLSIEQIIDCCKFCRPQDALGLPIWRYIEFNGLETSQDYPNTNNNNNSQCQYDPSKTVPGTKLKGLLEIIPANETDLKIKCATMGPIYVLIDASHRSFMLYHSGIYSETNCSSSQLDHAMLLVGYGSQDGLDYWIVKNTWGSDWGMNGYARISRNKKNMCGIASRAIVPMLGKR